MCDADLKYMSITLDRENQTFKAGDLVSGRVCAEFRQPTKVRGLRMEAVGEAVVGWTVSVASPNQRGESHNVSCTGREEYFSWKFYVLGSETGRMIELPVAQLSYPFSIQLPIDLPSSLEHENGCVRYTIKAIFERPWKSDCTVRNEISVDSNYDLNEKPQAALPIREVIQKKFGCLCFCPLGKLHATIFIPSTGFVPGQPISVTVHCENESTVDVRKIKVSLRKKLQLHATSPQWTTKEVESLIAEEQCVNPYTADFEDDVTVQLKVPPLLQPSGLEYCGLIDLSYSLRIVVGFSGLHCSVEKNFPILIGTVPLHNSSNARDPNIVTASQPTAPLLQAQSDSGAVGMAPLRTFGNATKSPPPAYEVCVQGAGGSAPPRFNPAHNYRPLNTGTNSPIPQNPLRGFDTRRGLNVEHGAMSLSNFKSVTIDLDREGETLKAGQLVSGRVTAELKELPMKVTGLRIVALGESVTHWESELKGDDGEDHMTPFIGREEYFNLNLYVIGSETSRPIELPIEQLLSYSFSFQLPHDLPSSLEDDLGYVRYSIRAIFERPSRSDCIFQLDYNVDSNYDLNQKPQARKSIRETIDKSFCCFCICPWGKLRATISLPSSGFVPGQSIPVTVHCENSSTIDVSKIKVSLKKKMVFHVHLPEQKTRTEDYTVAEAKCEYPFSTTFEDHVTVPLKVPAGLQPSGLEFCSIISLRYTLIVEVAFSGMHCSVKRRINILIGTVPLRVSANASNFGNVMAPSPSAPLLEPSAPPSYGSVYES